MKTLLTFLLGLVAIAASAAPAPLFRGPGTTNTPSNWTNVVRALTGSAGQFQTNQFTTNVVGQPVLGRILLGSTGSIGADFQLRSPGESLSATLGDQALENRFTMIESFGAGSFFTIRSTNSTVVTFGAIQPPGAGGFMTFRADPTLNTFLYGNFPFIIRDSSANEFMRFDPFGGVSHIRSTNVLTLRAPTVVVTNNMVVQGVISGNGSGLSNVVSTISDGDKGNVVVSSSGTVWLLDTTGTPNGSKFLRDDFSWQVIPGGGDALTTSPLSQFAATTSAQLRGVLTDEDGTGVFLTANGSGSGLTAVNAVTGDSATLFFSTGTLEDARLSANVTLLGSSIDLSGSEATGTLAAGRFPALTGDVTTSAGSLATSISPDSVALTTDTTGNYAAGDAEAGAALTGDSATAFFSTGTLEDARLSGNVTLLGSSIDLSGAEATGILAAGRFPALTGDVTTTAGSLATAIAPDSVALGTDTTGNYAAGDAEAGAALTGDSATAFFTAGQVERARGGTGADTSGYGAGLLGSDGSNNTIDVDTLAELETALGGLNILAATEIDTASEFFGIMTEATGSGKAVRDTSATILTPTLVGPVSSTNTLTFNVPTTVFTNDLVVGGNITASSLTISNLFWSTNTYGLATIDFAKGNETTTNMAGPWTITGIVGFNATNYNWKIVHCLANGADRTITMPAEWSVNGGGTTYIVTNGTTMDLLVESQIHVFTNASSKWHW